MIRALLTIIGAVVVAMLVGCSNGGADGAAPATTQAAPTQDAATRKEPVVAGRPARVFVFAGVGTKCEPVAAPVVTITAQPTKGDLTLKPGQDTAIAASAAGTCVGAKTTGTGVYYTARAGATGTDRFAVEAKLASGEISTRTFEVTIAE
jgi:hypothetical protein